MHMHQFKQKAVIVTLLIACTMHLQAFEMKLEINGGNIITPAVEQVKKATSTVITGGLQMLNTLPNLRVPCLWQLQDDKIVTTYIHPGALAIAGAYGLLSIACFKGVWEAYKRSKYYSADTEEYKNKQRMLSCLAATCGTVCACLTAVILYGSTHQVA